MSGQWEIQRNKASRIIDFGMISNKPVIRVNGTDVALHPLFGQLGVCPISLHAQRMYSYSLRVASPRHEMKEAQIWFGVQYVSCKPQSPYCVHSDGPSLILSANSCLSFKFTLFILAVKEMICPRR